MATWMVHLRVAEQMLEVFPRLERQEFIVGNIAPDSGVPNEDWSVFTPDTNTSHFKTDGEIDIPKFLNKYMTGEKRRNPFSSDTMCTCLRMSCGAMKWYIRR